MSPSGRDVIFYDKEAKAYLNQREFMFLHAGDCFQGTLYFSLYKGMANAVLLNAIGVEAMALGNHELDMGNDCVADFLDHTHFPLLAGNWDLSQEDQTKSNPENHSTTRKLGFYRSCSWGIINNPWIYLSFP